MIDQRDSNMEFGEYIKDGIEKGGFHTEDALYLLLPFFENLSKIHQEGQVAPFQDISLFIVQGGVLVFPENQYRPILTNKKILDKIRSADSKAFEIVEEYEEKIEIGSGYFDVQDFTLKELSKENPSPVFLPDYKSYEIELGHHDPITDVYMCGLLLASCIFNINLFNKDDYKEFSSNLKALYLFDKKVHPSLVNLINEMIQLDRKDRIRDMQTVLLRIKHYRDYNPESRIDLTQTEGFKVQSIEDRSNWIINKLRLFDISRRNKLLHFSKSSKFLNLTIASVPYVLNYEYLKPEQLFTWNKSVSEKIISGDKFL